MDNIIRNAGNESWMAGLVAFILVTVIGFLVWLVKAWLKEAEGREARMNARIDKLEDFAQTTLLAALGDNSDALNALTAKLSVGPCFLEEERKRELLAKAVKEIVHA